MDVHDSLSKGQKARSMILACQARALSQNLKVFVERSLGCLFAVACFAWDIIHAAKHLQLDVCPQVWSA